MATGLKSFAKMAEVIASYDAACCLMHNRKDTTYADFMSDVISDLEETLTLAKAAGIREDGIMLDPGVGFAKSYEQNLYVTNHVDELVALGYLEQPHTSAGRIPSPAGYRFYIDRLMQDYRLSVDETQSINQAMELRMQEFYRAMSKVGKLVSQLTNLPAYAMTSHTESVKVRRFEMLPAEDVCSGKINMHDYKKFVVTFKASELPRAGGGARCMTMPVQRMAVDW